MLGYEVKFETVTVGTSQYTIRSLLDRMQYWDPHGDAERAGVSSASWPLFGLIWPSARVLALAMDSFDIAGKRVLEIGAGLALASLVIHRRHGNMTVSDRHPLSPVFLCKNTELNHMQPLNYVASDWSGANPGLGRFELIIGSDVLYERQQPAQLAAFIDNHAAPAAQIVIVDPDRGNRARFCQEMNRLGFECSAQRVGPNLESGEPYKGRILAFKRLARPMM
jgi:2-polyprenyl-3-methyl-5-hydroxy-6-metoxy-1,4-benzoquinol methylase